MQDSYIGYLIGFLLGLIIFGNIVIRDIYNKIQLHRAEEIYKIRMKWLRDSDSRYYSYSYKRMLHTGFFKKRSWRLPKDEDYKIL